MLEGVLSIPWEPRDVRLQRGVDVAGVDPDVARRLARGCHGSDPQETEVVAARAVVDVGAAAVMLQRLEGAGFLERSDTAWRGEPCTAWATTVRGGALANASFLKPMSRRQAEMLLAGVLDRARSYNEDPAKPMWVDRIAVFGSLLDDEATDFGDIDLQVSLSDRPSSDRARSHVDFARASGRSFSTFMGQLLFAERDALQTLKNRSGRISVHTEDVTRFTDRWKVVFERDDLDRAGG